MYVVYILQSNNYSYIGMTNDFYRRWEQHNGIRKGGARYTSKFSDWTPICIIDGFKTKSEAMQCEWRLKRVKGFFKRILNVSKIMNHRDTMNRWTTKSPLIIHQKLTIYVIEKYKYLFLFDTKELNWF